ncbi:MAG: NAD(P)H-dependent oxidoreductase [Vulcanimicrobiota bacterium]
MKTLLLNGQYENQPVLEKAQSLFEEKLKQKNFQVESIRLSDKKIAPCAGCFKCWLGREPGVCVIKDDVEPILSSFANCDLAIWLTPVVFGGYSFQLKKALDRFIPMVSPLLTMINDEMHHVKRYEKYPRVICLGWQPEIYLAGQYVFKSMFIRNTINMHSPSAEAGVVTPENQDNLEEIIENLIYRVIMEPRQMQVKNKQVTILVGSPKKKGSSSQNIAGFIREEFEKYESGAEIVHLLSSMEKPENENSLVENFEKSDIIFYVGPLYVDSIPSRAIKALEVIHSKFKNSEKARKFIAISQCGFAEDYQNGPAIRILEQFARQTNLQWAGGFTVGAGGALQDKKIGSFLPAKNMVKALEMAVEALVKNKPIPERAFYLFSSPLMPQSLYSVIGNLMFRWEAFSKAGVKDLNKQPYKIEKNEKTAGQDKISE